ncbi:zinc-binding dehydrogenase [Alcaligenes sp. A-TC2]|uniref:zinc-binding dehydrogenase n=1 Tax=Alcaligenes TaxID=507 RepID=UPI00052CC7E0|nr:MULTISPECIES: zinc-binding dehydrogenase [Alcaligenes]KGP01904.1 NADH oxidase [Alcaligenes faecalis]MCX5471513.1 zinc-binding dehydrogenase [Alcaligenes nematophilus]USY25985.1 zinc-binding dehydrogenase [Alcaligenes sp. 1735tsa3]
MNKQRTSGYLQLRSLVNADAQLELFLAHEPVPAPGPEEVLIRIDAAPVNPSDLGLLFAAADMSTVRLVEREGYPCLLADIPEAAMPGLQGRLGQALAVGYEGTGIVVATGQSEQARQLDGKRVAAFGGGMYSQYACVPVQACLVLPDRTTAQEGASAFVNPLTSLGMVETMRSEGHTALVHTAAASNLGQMLNRICLEDGVGLVNIVRKPEQADLLRAQGAVHVCDSSSDTFNDDLIQAITATGATLAFDATGGGTLAGQILGAMESVLSRAGGQYSRYGSTTHKQVYLYGGLESGPTRFERNFGMAWGMGGWVLWAFLRRMGPQGVARLKERIVAGLTTTFHSHYSQAISMVELLQPETIALCNRRGTGEKFLLFPNG